MAEPKQAEPPAQTQLPKDQAVRLADQAIIAFTTFIQTGSDVHKAKFIELWDANNANNDFFARFQEGIKKNPQVFQQLLKAYKDKFGDWPNPKTLVEAVSACYEELKKPVGARDKAKLDGYGPSFIAEVSKFVANIRGEMIKLGDQAATALITFIQTGKDSQKLRFFELWDNYGANNEFFDRFIEGIKSNPQVFQQLVKAYKEQAGEDPNPRKLAEQVAVCYTELKKPEDKRDQSKLAEFGPAFITEMQRIMAGGTMPVRVPSQIDDNTMGVFYKLYSVKFDAGASKEDKMRALVNAVKLSFGLTDFGEAQEVTMAILNAYTLLGGDDQKRYLEYLRAMNANQQMGLAAEVVQLGNARTLKLPYESVKISFEKWKEDMEKKRDKISALESSLKATPLFIREGKLDGFIADFVKEPSDYNIELVSRRLEYVRKRQEVLTLKKKPGDDEAQKKIDAELKKLDAEVTALKDWLKTLKLPSEKPEDGIRELRSGFIFLQQQYYSLTPDNPTVVDALTKVPSSNPLFLIYKKYLSALDSKTGRLFEDVDPASEDYLKQVARSVHARLNADRVKRGQAQWFTDYFPTIVPNMSSPSLPLIQAYNKIAALDPLLGAVFFDYLELAKRNGLTNIDEMKLVATTAAKLYAINPFLTLKYFQAIKHLAELCEDNTEAFKAALLRIAARTDAETDPFLSSVAPTPILPLNQRRIVSNLGNAFDAISRIEKAKVAQWDRLNTLDDQVVISQSPPHDIEQRPSAWAPRFLGNPYPPTGYNPPFPFPVVGPGVVANMPMAGGGVGVSPNTYSGSLALPMISPYNVVSGANMFGTAMKLYLNPQLFVPSISTFLPGVNIVGLSMTKLMNEIDRDFIPTERPEYSMEPIGGGGGAGVAGSKAADHWSIGGGGVGTYITPTGGISAGGMVDETRTFGGLSAVAVPIAIPVITGPPGSRSVSGIDSALAGHEELSDGTKNTLVRVLQTTWDPENPSQKLIVINDQQLPTGATDQSGNPVTSHVMTARYFYVDKQGTIFDLKGGQNDFLDTLNFVAGYGNQQFNTPTTYAWNVEPKIQIGTDSSGNPVYGVRGGGVLAIDIGKTALLAHAQAVPFFMPQGTPQPFLLQWTPGFATTVNKAGGTGAVIHQVTFPGQMLVIVPDQTNPTQKQIYKLQDVDYMLRNVDKTDRWELRAGAGIATSPVGLAGRGGFFLRTQSPKQQAGGGIYYEAGSTDLAALALLSQAQSQQQYVQSLHRIGETVYLSKETANRMVIGALAHTLEQLKQDQQTGSITFDQFFYRFVGIIDGLKSIGAWKPSARIDISRYNGLDQMMLDYEKMKAQIGADPTQAASLLQNFYNQYNANVAQVWDSYFLGISINKTLSLEAGIVTREAANTWTSQVPDTVSGRVLFTWKTGFWRAFSAIPLLTPGPLSQPLTPGAPVAQNPSSPLGQTGATATTQTMSAGIVGTGVGQDLLNGFWMQRAAADVGVLVARYESGPQAYDAMGRDIRQWSQAGFFVQGAVKLFSNVLDDSNRYRKLVEEENEYLDHIRNGEFASLPEGVLKAIANGLQSPQVPKELIEAIRNGKNITFTSDQRDVKEFIESSFWRNWFVDKKMAIQKDFNGHFRMFLGASGYFYSDRTYWDVGTFIEVVNKVKLYAVAAKREEMGVWFGGDVTHGRWQVSALGGVTESGGGGMGSVSLRLGGDDTLPVNVGLMGYGMGSNYKPYTAPFYYIQPAPQIPSFGGFVFFTIGGGSGVPYLPGAGPTPYVPGSPNIPGSPPR